MPWLCWKFDWKFHWNYWNWNFLPTVGLRIKGGLRGSEGGAGIKIERSAVGDLYRSPPNRWTAGGGFTTHVLPISANACTTSAETSVCFTARLTKIFVFQKQKTCFWNKKNVKNNKKHVFCVSILVGGENSPKKHVARFQKMGFFL